MTAAEFPLSPAHLNMNPSKILCLGTTPAVQRVMIFRKLALDAVNRATTTLDGAAGKSVNVAKVLKALGEQPIAMGFLGGDHGEIFAHGAGGKGNRIRFRDRINPDAAVHYGD